MPGWNAFWMWVFGESWRVTHAVAVGGHCGRGVFVSRFCLLPVLFATLATSRISGGDSADWLQLVGGAVCTHRASLRPYALFLMVVAFRLAVASAGRQERICNRLAGCAAGASAASSLLTVPAAPVVLLWILVYNRVGRRTARFSAFIAGTAVPFLPVLWLFVQGPFQVRFGIIDFHLFYRQVDWDGSMRHNLELMTVWINSSHALFLGSFAVAGFFTLRGEAGGSARAARSFISPSGWPSGLIGISLLRAAHVRAVFLADGSVSGNPGGGGFLCSCLTPAFRPTALAAVFRAGVSVVFGLARDIYDDRDSAHVPGLREGRPKGGSGHPA